MIQLTRDAGIIFQASETCIARPLVREEFPLNTLATLLLYINNARKAIYNK